MVIIVFIIDLFHARYVNSFYLSTGLQSALQLQEKLSCNECTAVVNCLATSELNWDSQHMKYLVMETAVPGSGVATTLSCDLSAFNWEFLFKKQNFDRDIMQAILSLRAVLGLGDLKRIVCNCKVTDSNAEVLSLALDKCSQVDITFLNSLSVEALKLKKIHFLGTLVSHGATVDASSLVKRMTVREISQNKPIYSHIQSTPEGREVLMKSALKVGDMSALKDCEVLLQSCKDELNLNALVLHAIQGSTEKKKTCILFIRGLLESKRVNPNGQDGQKCPLDAVLELSREYAASKLEFLCLLLQHGANIQRCTFPGKNQTTFLHIATQFAIDECKSIIN